MTTVVTILGVHAYVAEGFFQRLLGLMFRRDLQAGEGLLITRCNAIHTCFMRFPIDATFFDGNGVEVKTVRNIRPWSLFVWGGFRTASVLETASAI